MILNEEQVRKVSREARILAERLQELGCDSVAVMVTFPLEDGFTGSRVVRAGNYWAQRGLVQGWLESVRDEEQAKAIASEVILTDEE